MPRTVSASTARTEFDPGLKGRTYAIPFEDVWQGTLRLVRGKLRGWSLEEADDDVGLVIATIRVPLRSLCGIIEIRIGLDPNGQTRVDATAATPAAFHDFGANARRLRRFFRALDREAARERDRRRAAAPAAP
jgi:hypothetical protein